VWRETESGYGERGQVVRKRNERVGTKLRERQSDTMRKKDRERERDRERECVWRETESGHETKGKAK